MDVWFEGCDSNFEVKCSNLKSRYKVFLNWGM